MLIKNCSYATNNEKRSKWSIGRIYCLCLINILIIFVLSGCSHHSPAYFRDNPENRPLTHKVVAGDTLFSIAWRYGVKYEALAKYNGISKPYLIHPNQVIRLDVPAHLIRAR